jgi:dihydrofolate reductase
MRSHMRKITTFTHVSVDGFFAGPNGEIDWFHSIPKDDEFERFTHEASSSRSTLFMGRTTYDMMKSFWPTPEAAKTDPHMAEVMRNSPKVVFSKSLQSVEESRTWKNVELLHDVERERILELKQRSDITILGSGSIVQQLTSLGLIDDYTLVVVPVVLGRGKPLFKDVSRTALRLRDSKAFGNGLVVNHYSP